MDQAGLGSIAGLLSRLGLPSGLLSPLVAHAESVAVNSPRLGLVSTGDERAILRRHTADSLVVALARQPQANELWADVGSGGGFPGVPLAICYPNTKFTLVEASHKKAGYLELLGLDLGLPNLTVAATRAESLDRSFDVGVCRAVAKPDEAMRRLSTLVRAGGECIVMASEAISGTRQFRADLPDVDSPCLLSMMTAGGEA